MPRAPDWYCSTCKMTVFGSKPACSKCGKPNPGMQGAATTASSKQQASAAQPSPATATTNSGGGASNAKLDDWFCPSCKMTIWGSKPCCTRCGTANPNLAEQKKELNRTGRAPDWSCPKCSMIVFGSKSECFKCHTKKPIEGNAPKVSSTASAKSASAEPSGQQQATAKKAQRGGAAEDDEEPAVATLPFTPPRGAHRLPDWPCPTCKKIIFGSKAGCSVCGHPNPGLVSAVEQAGSGGGTDAVAAMARREQDLMRREKEAHERAAELRRQMDLAGEQTAKVDALKQEAMEVEQRLEEMKLAERSAGLKSTAPPPPYWELSDEHPFPTPGFSLHELTEERELDEFRAIVRATGKQQAATFAKKKVRVFRVQNDSLWVKFATQRQLMTSPQSAVVCETMNHVSKTAAAAATKNNTRGVGSGGVVLDPKTMKVDLNEGYFWHGTHSRHVDTICDQGFDERVGSLGGFFGSGVYFAESFDKSIAYASSGGGASGTPMFLARVVLGNVTDVGTKHMQQARRAPDGFDAIIGRASTGGAREFVVYDRRQTYPEFLILFS